MKKLLIIFAVISVFMQFGCQQSMESKERDLLKGVKLSDLAPQKYLGSTSGAKGFQGDFLLMVFDLPKKGHDVFAKVKPRLNTNFISSEARAANSANGIYMASGREDDWYYLAQAIEQGGGKVYKRVDLLVFDSKGDWIPIRDIKQSGDYFYQDAHGSLAGQTVSAGTLGWNLIVEDDLQAKGALTVSLSPALMTGRGNVYRKLLRSGRGEASSDLGKPLGFGETELLMSGGDFLVAAADSGEFEDFSPAGLIFPVDESMTTLRVYVLFCRSVRD